MHNEKFTLDAKSGWKKRWAWEQGGGRGAVSREALAALLGALAVQM